jgi:nucleotide-binding universal stress UspA family protein
MVSRILVPTDGSETARKAAIFAVDLAKQLDATIIILSVVNQSSFVTQIVSAAETPLHVIEPVDDYLNEAARGYVAELEKLCEKHSVRSEIIVTGGQTVEIIVKEAKKSKADLIVIGSHGRSALAASILGSVAYGVIHNESRTPVLIVRR